MKFTDSPVIEVPVGDGRLSLQQDNGSMHIGPASSSSSIPRPLGPACHPENPYAHLVDYRGKRAVELGTGCGAAGMGLYLLGLTDIAPVMPALRHNLKRNKPVLNKTPHRNSSDHIKSLNPPFDIVVATDVVYIEESVGHLVEAMAALVKSNGLVLLGYQLRSPEADKRFWKLCEEVFVKEKVRHEDLHPEHAYEEADVYILRKKKDKKKDKEDEL
ncbi:LOW QUALITY PROTEIN: hypothetical protein BT93_A1633 [Corymbia citriodora subsp. variegata]|nr:LOW QUALITY PROTEIN: hypothetical protein BT93_A1633 [Corymbia citriodora subsp. variegata]